MTFVAAGITLFNPDIELLKENIDSIKEQVNLIILIDNASRNINHIESILTNYCDIVLIKNDKNMGIARALNQIVEYSNSNNYKWVLFLDQDSKAPQGLVENYIKYLDLQNIAVISPKILDINDKIDNSNSTTESSIEFIDRCITSASLVNISICQSLGKFDEKMFIDLVDFEYCARVRRRNYKIIRVNSIILAHRLGDLRVVKIFAKKIYVTNHSKERIYYFARNAIYFDKLHKDYLPKYYAIREIIKLIIKIIFFEKMKKSKIKFAFKGISDGLCGSMDTGSIII